MAEVDRKTVKAQELPTEWRREPQLAPDQEVVVATARPSVVRAGKSPKRFIAAGTGLFASAQEVDAYLQRQRDAWKS